MLFDSCFIPSKRPSYELSRGTFSMNGCFLDTISLHLILSTPRCRRPKTYLNQVGRRYSGVRFDVKLTKNALDLALFASLILTLAQETLLHILPIIGILCSASISISLQSIHGKYKVSSNCTIFLPSLKMWQRMCGLYSILHFFRASYTKM